MYSMAKIFQGLNRPSQWSLKFNMRFFLIIALSIGLFVFGTSVDAGEGAPGVSKKLALNNYVQKIRKTISLETKCDPNSIVMPVNPKTGASIATGKIVVMFQSEFEMRASRTAGTDLFSTKGKDPLPAISLVLKYGATIRQAIDLDPRVLDEFRSRTQRKARKSMPDLAGMMYVEGIEPSQLVTAAREFLMLPDVLWVEVEKKIKVAGGDPIKTG